MARQCNEFYFDPTLSGSEHNPGIVSEITTAIKSVPDAGLRGDMWGNILLAGGASQTKGMLERVKAELRRRGHDHARVSLVPHGGRASWRGAARLTGRQLKWITAGGHQHT